MGNGPSNRRNGRIQNQNHIPPPRMVPPPSGYPGNSAPHSGPGLYPSNGHHAAYFYPPNYNGAMTAPMGPPQFYPHQYMPTSNGQYMMSLQQQGFRPVHQNSAPQAHTPAPIAESQKAYTIRNDVNLKKATLRLEKDEENPGFHRVAFSFDATVAGSISIFFVAKEKEQCSFTPLRPSVYKVTRVPFEKGLVQKFQQAPGCGVNLSMFDDRELSKGEDSIYPLVVRTETLGKDPPANFSLLDDVPENAPLPKWVHCQTTQAVIEKKDDGNYKVKVIRQTLWVDSKYYELQEIYGIENSGGSDGFEGNDSGKECVICMSEPRDTTVLPCRHMCMCSECAKVLRYQTNRCPICRTPVERLLEIKVPQTESYDPMSVSVTDACGASASQSTAGQTSGGLGGMAVKEDIKV